MKIKEVYICSNCEVESLKWSGKCPNCSSWNTMTLKIKSPTKHQHKSISSYSGDITKPFALNQIDISNEKRYKTRISELDRVLGGGIVRGSLILFSGAPGIGKSTLLLQICKHIDQNLRILYISGEESINQIKLRADRIKILNDNLYILTENNVEKIESIIDQFNPDIVIIDSIQTMVVSNINSPCGTISQVRESSNSFISIAKSRNIPIILVGHINKDGAIAGPKVLEHIVDAVMCLEGDRNTFYRILRCSKNRYGSTNEIGIFEMTKQGLSEIQNPSKMLLQGSPNHMSGSCITCIIEGSRPILIEIQALVTKTSFGTPRRSSTGLDYNRMSLIIAILEKKAGYHFGNLDVYLNIVGGIKVDDPACDIAVSFAIISSLLDISIPNNYVFFGELSLSGEIRPVPNFDIRIKESIHLGFEKCIVPNIMKKSIANISDKNIKYSFIENITQLSKFFNGK